MFERFDTEARRTIVLAQEEARLLQHNYIGTEHMLLGLLHEGGAAAGAVEQFGLTLTACRDEVLAMIGPGKQAPSGHIPFTPRAKRCLELSLREALQLGDDHIGTVHVLLGILREGQGVAAQIIKQHAGDLAAVRTAVVGRAPHAARHGSRLGRLLAGAGSRASRAVGLRVSEPAEAGPRTTPAADTSLAEAARLAGGGAVGSHHLLLAALADTESAAARALTSAGVDLDRAREALRHADVTGSTDELREEAGRRQMMIRVEQERIIVEATDPAIVRLGREALEALGDLARDGSVIPGDAPVAESLADVWEALHESLRDIRRRADVAGAQSAAQEEQDQQDEQGEQSG